VFHFNKKHLEDQTIPMWVIKTHGETFYVHHVSADIAWSTKETPDNSHTKGSIKFKECLLTIDPENNASIGNLSIFDKVRLRNQKLGITRILFHNEDSFAKILKDEKIKHSPFKTMRGACGSSFTICDLLEKKHATYLSLKYTNKFRILMPNETYYQAYDDRGVWEKLVASLDDDYFDPEDDEDDDE
jgi:hypothetical protein